MSELKKKQKVGNRWSSVQCFQQTQLSYASEVASSTGSTSTACRMLSIESNGRHSRRIRMGWLCTCLEDLKCPECFMSCRPAPVICSSWTCWSPMSLPSCQGRSSQVGCLWFLSIPFDSFCKCFIRCHICCRNLSQFGLFPFLPLLPNLCWFSASQGSGSLPRAAPKALPVLVGSMRRMWPVVSFELLYVTLRYFESTLCIVGCYVIAPVNEFGTLWHWLSKFCVCVSVSFKSLAKEAGEELGKCQPTKNWGRCSIRLHRTVRNFSLAR